MSDWPNGFNSGDKVTGGFYGYGIVASHTYCMGKAPEQRGKIIKNTGIRRGLVPVKYRVSGMEFCFWESPYNLKKID